MTVRADTDRLAADLDRIIADARAIKNQLVDLDLAAYERPSRTDDIKVNSSTAGYSLDDIGSADAKRALRNLTRTAAHTTKDLHRERAAVFNLFAGPGADQTLRGTTISKKTFEQQVAAQKRRKEAPNDYVPERIEKQPDYPKGKR